MITESNFIWYIKAVQLTVLVLLATGIFMRWKVETKSRKVLAFMFLVTSTFYTVDVILGQSFALHPLMLQQGRGLGYSFGALYNGMVIATFTYLYTRAVFIPERLTVRWFIRANIISIVSFSVYILLLILGFRPVSGYDAAELWEHTGDNPFVLLWISTVVLFYVYVVYISVVVVRWLMIHRRNIKNNFSLVGGFRYYCIYVTYLLFGSTLPLGIMSLLYKADMRQGVAYGISFIFIILLIYIFSSLQKDIYSEKLPMEDIETSKSDEKQLIRFSDRRLIEKLRVLIEEERIYTQPDLSAETLASIMEISRKKLYLFLKEYYNSIFSDYINGCRIEHAERLMKDKECRYLTILEISEMSGFNSVGTFNKFFKAKYHTTPAKYRNEIEV